MAGQIIFFDKNKADYEQDFVTVTASEGDATADRVLNRSNLDGWVTEGSQDSSNTTFEIDLVDTREIDSILLAGHNFKSFKVEYWTGAAWAAFSPAIDETAETADGSFFEVASVSSSKVKLTVRGTQTADDDKILKQFIVTRKIGQLDAWPVIKSPKLDRDLRKNKMLSSKLHLVESVETYSAKLDVKILKLDADLELIETLYEMNEGFLFWPCGGDESQFSSIRKGYRFEDIYLVRAMNPHSPGFYKGLYQSGIQITIDLAEVIT